MTAFSRAAALEVRELREAVKDFYAHEAWLLDTRQFEMWLELLADDIDYRVPIAENVATDGGRPPYRTGPLDVSWMHEGKDLLDARVRQILTGFHWAEEPPSRTCHVVSNVQVVSPGTSQDITARCALVIHRNRNDSEEDTVFARREDVLLEHGDTFLVRKRTVWIVQSVLNAKNITTFM